MAQACALCVRKTTLGQTGEGKQPSGMHSSNANALRDTTVLLTWQYGVSRHSNAKQLVRLVGFVPSPMNGRLLYTIPQNSHWTENESWRVVSNLNGKKWTNGSWRNNIPNTQTTEGMDVEGKRTIKYKMKQCVFLLLCSRLQINLLFGWCFRVGVFFYLKRVSQVLTMLQRSWCQSQISLKFR